MKLLTDNWLGTQLDDDPEIITLEVCDEEDADDMADF